MNATIDCANNSRTSTAIVTRPRAGVSAYRLAWHRMLRHKMGCTGLVVCLAVVLMALLAPAVAPHDPTETFYDAILSPPSWHFLLGTDDLGRDIFSRLLYGAQVSLKITFISVGGAVVIGSALGTLSGYAGGWVDNLIMRIVDGMLAFPMLVLALGIVSVLGPSVTNAMIAITIVNIPSFARLVRAQVLTVRQLDFVTAARALGASDMRIMLHHVWPSVVGNVIVYASLRASAALITESSLAFLGLGAQPPMPSWGQMLSTAMQYWDAWWMSVFPGIAIFITVLSLNFIGDGLRDSLDSRLST